MTKEQLGAKIREWLQQHRDGGLVQGVYLADEDRESETVLRLDLTLDTEALADALLKEMQP